MANITLNSSTYAGYFDDVILASAVLGARAIEGGYVEVHTAVDDKMTAVFVDSDVQIEDGNGAFSSSSTTDLSEIKFELGKFMINAEIDYKNLDNFWLASQQPRGAAGDYVAPASLEDALNLHFSRKMALYVGASLWSGTGGAIDQFGSSESITKNGSNSVTGLIDAMLADASVNDLGVGGTYKQTVTGASEAASAVIGVADASDYAIGDKVTFESMAGGTWATQDGKTFSITAINSNDITIDLDSQALGTWSAGTLTCVNKNNVVNALEAMYAAMSDSIRLAPDTFFYVPSHIAAAYKMKQAEAAYAPNVYSADYRLSYLGYELKEDPAQRQNTIVLCRKASLHFATPLLSDLNQVLIVDQSQTNASRTIRYRMDIAFGCNISDPAKITLLS